MHKLGLTQKQQLENYLFSFVEKCSHLSDISHHDIADIIKSFLEHNEHITEDNSEHIDDKLINKLKIYLADRISVSNISYQYLAGCIHIDQLISKTFDRQIPKFKDHVINMVNLGLYDRKLIELITPDELEVISTYIDNNRDYNFHYSAAITFCDKYIMQYRSQNKYFETPQLLYLSIACAGFMRYPQKVRLSYIKRFYDAISQQQLTLATPVLANVRGTYFSTSSCVCVDSDDSIESMGLSGAITMLYTAQRSGLGINVGRIRGMGTAIKKGIVKHAGILPFINYFQGAVKSCSQTGVRGGSATVFCPIFHLESELYLQLKNNQGSHENRVPHLDYCIQINGYFYQKLINNEDIYLIDHTACPGVYTAFFQDQELFKQLYEQLVDNPTVKKRKISAHNLFTLLANNRAQTGRVYIQHVDHSNMHSSFKTDIAPIFMSNLCMEITLPTKPITHFLTSQNRDYEVALCTLSAVNLGSVDQLSDLQPLCDLIARFLDQIIEHQFYPIEAVKRTGQMRRSLGIGITNLSYFLAQRQLKYNELAGINMCHQIFESLQYYLLLTSNQLAIEFGACEGYNETKYSLGQLPIDHYNKNIDQHHQQDLIHDWESLRQKIKHYGLRNSTLTCQMPCESTAHLNGCTPGMYPAFADLLYKADKSGSIPQILPKADILSYQHLWDLNARDMIVISAIAQKFFDQSLSTNTHYDCNQYDDKKIPIKLILQDMLFAYNIGIKTLYYHYSREIKPEIKQNTCTSCSL